MTDGGGDGGGDDDEGAHAELPASSYGGGCSAPGASSSHTGTEASSIGADIGADIGARAGPRSSCGGRSGLLLTAASAMAARVGITPR